MSKPILLLLHGALGSADQLFPIRDLLKNDYDIRLITFSGHGGVPFNDQGFSISVFTEEVYTYLEAHQIHKAHVFGYSMGGYVALNLASKYPDRVGKIFTLATKFDWNPVEAQKEVRNLNPDIIEEKIPKFAVILKERHTPNDWKTVLNRTAQLMVDLGNGGKLSKDDLSDISHRVLISIGSEDRMVSIQESQDAASSLINAKLHIFEGFKHPIEQVDIQILAKQVQDHINNSI